MGQVSSKLRGGQGFLTFWCPGCQQGHTVSIDKGDGHPCWGYNGNPESPTFTPSILLRTGHYASHWVGGMGCWCTYAKDHPEDEDPFKCVVCHSFVTDGMIQYLGDCTHELAGQTIPMPDLPDFMKDQGDGDGDC